MSTTNDRRHNTKLSADIIKRERKRSNRQLVWAVAVQVLVTTLLLAAIFVTFSDSRSTATRATRMGCQSANLTRAYVRIFATALNAVRDMDLNLPQVRGVPKANPIIDCDLLPAVRRPLPPGVQTAFVMQVAAGLRPEVHRGAISLVPGP